MTPNPLASNSIYGARRPPCSRTPGYGRLARISTLLGILVATTTPLEAQIMSPGKLAAPHGELAGVRNCTSCHELRKAGAIDDKCLACHEPLANRLERGTGFHATVSERSCASCHREHRGVDYDLIQLDTAAFDHTETGFNLAGGHAQAECRDCHTADLVEAVDVRTFKGDHGALDRTLLGLASSCATCHSDDDPHADQLTGQACNECHSERDWNAADRFDHGRTRYRLTGSHRQTDCADCHKKARTRRGEWVVSFTRLSFGNCGDCHEDTHNRQLGDNCTSCHTTADWHRVARATVEDRFNHDQTDFPLAGGHAEAECEACHARTPARTERVRISYRAGTRRFTYPEPLADDCNSCHVDSHARVFVDTPGGTVCDNCHNDQAWLPVDYDIARHNREADYALEGAHIATPCIDCHATPDRGREADQFRVAADDCQTCHANDDPHAAQFAGAPCEDCHKVSGFRIANFDHSTTRYPLDGEHRDTACNSCHLEEQAPTGELVRRYKPLERECRACHREAANG